ncbi:unnamed protein product [Amoebophrya sp. A120]|nr:unnamed protein product [Amoebophrya sp. A120]|eukprot:GSA120T00005328001.1
MSCIFQFGRPARSSRVALRVSRTISKSLRLLLLLKSTAILPVDHVQAYTGRYLRRERNGVTSSKKQQYETENVGDQEEDTTSAIADQEEIEPMLFLEHPTPMPPRHDQLDDSVIQVRAGGGAPGQNIDEIALSRPPSKRSKTRHHLVRRLMRPRSPTSAVAAPATTQGVAPASWWNWFYGPRTTTEVVDEADRPYDVVEEEVLDEPSPVAASEVVVQQEYEAAPSYNDQEVYLDEMEDVGAPSYTASRTPRPRYIVRRSQPHKSLAVIRRVIVPRRTSSTTRDRPRVGEEEILVDGDGSYTDGQAEEAGDRSPRRPAHQEQVPDLHNSYSAARSDGGHDNDVFTQRSSQQVARHLSSAGGQHPNPTSASGSSFIEQTQRGDEEGKKEQGSSTGSASENKEVQAFTRDIRHQLLACRTLADNTLKKQRTQLAALSPQPLSEDQDTERAAKRLELENTILDRAKQINADTASMLTVDPKSFRIKAIDSSKAIDSVGLDVDGSASSTPLREATQNERKLYDQAREQITSEQREQMKKHQDDDREAMLNCLQVGSTKLEGGRARAEAETDASKKTSYLEAVRELENTWKLLHARDQALLASQQLGNLRSKAQDAGEPERFVAKRSWEESGKIRDSFENFYEKIKPFTTAVTGVVKNQRDLQHNLGRFSRNLHASELSRDMEEEHWKRLRDAQEVDAFYKIGDISLTGQYQPPKDLPKDYNPNQRQMYVQDFKASK